MKEIPLNKINLNNEPENYTPSLKDNVVFFPVRHHSPLVSYLLSKFIDKYKPKLILTEGPSNINKIKHKLFDKNAKMPLAFYSITKEETKTKNENGKEKKEILKESVYYPFTEFSPEYIALKKSKENKIEAFFIDLNYLELKKYISNYENILTEKNLVYSEYIKRLTDKLGLNDFNELWENYFETVYFNKKPETFIKDFYKYCFYSRKTYDFKELLSDGTLIRELYMASKIKKYMKTYDKILVIAGGFHLPSLISLVNEDIKTEFENNGDIENYIVPYSYDKIDERSGYKSGITYPFYRERLLKNFLYEKKDSPIEENLIYFLHKFHKEFKKNSFAGTIVNKIEAVRMMNELKHLRDKEQLTLYELKDALISSYAKSPEEVNKVLYSLDKALTSNKKGKFIYTESDSPILKDFNDNLKKNKIHSIEKTQKSELYPEKNSSQKNKSIFFHKLVFLEVNFAYLLVKGKKQQGIYQNNPLVKIREYGKGNFLNDSNSYFTEVWEYGLKHDTYETLIQASFYGSSIDEAVLNKFEDEWSRTFEFSKAANLYITMLKLEINSENKKKLNKLKYLSDNEMSFYSLTKGFSVLYNYLYFETKNKTTEYIYDITFDNIIDLLYLTDNLASEEEKEYAQGIKTVFSIVFKNEEKKSLFAEAVKTLSLKLDSNLELKGAIDGVLYSGGELEEKEVLKFFEGILNGVNSAKNTADYLSGLFLTARELFLLNDFFIKKLSYYLLEFSEKEFLEILPDFKRVFNGFTPMEQGKISRKISKLFNIAENFENNANDSDTEITGLILEKEVKEFIKKHNLIDL